MGGRSGMIFPVALLTMLDQAVATVDIEVLEATIDQIRAVNRALADDLSQIARTFDYARLEQLLEKNQREQQTNQ
ncbi:MAG: hypothetical protein R2867_31860 [Caldilineaceae bacterium]